MPPRLSFPKWVPDDTSNRCQECRSEFTLLHRRHHCRCCGQLLCAGCTDKRVIMPRPWESPDPQRVCNKCYRTLSVEYGCSATRPPTVTEEHRQEEERHQSVFDTHY